MEFDDEQEICPCCGYRGLFEPPRPFPDVSLADASLSFDICPSCRFQFGVTDQSYGVMAAAHRGVWVVRGFPWASEVIAKPEGWDPVAQVTSIPAKVIEDYNRSLRPVKFWINPEDPNRPQWKLVGGKKVLVERKP